MTDRGADLEAALLEEIERRWAESDRARSRVVRPARRALFGVPSETVRQVENNPAPAAD